MNTPNDKSFVSYSTTNSFRSGFHLLFLACTVWYLIKSVVLIVSQYLLVAAPRKHIYHDFNNKCATKTMIDSVWMNLNAF